MGGKTILCIFFMERIVFGIRNALDKLSDVIWRIFTERCDDIDDDDMLGMGS